jgi:hypothetical protein
MHASSTLLLYMKKRIGIIVHLSTIANGPTVMDPQL